MNQFIWKQGIGDCDQTTDWFALTCPYCQLSLDTCLQALHCSVDLLAFI